MINDLEANECSNCLCFDYGYYIFNEFYCTLCYKDFIDDENNEEENLD